MRSGLQDAFEKLNMPGEALRGRIRIQYVDHYGEVEAGVDGGGLFKDFMEHLIRQGFDPQARGIYCILNPTKVRGQHIICCTLIPMRGPLQRVEFACS
jgi:hypothetical protein